MTLGGGDRRVLASIGVGVAVGVLAVAATAILAALLDVPHDFLTREPQRALRGRPSAGVTSNVGAVVWGVGFVCAALAASLTTGRRRQMYVSGAVLVGVMYLDDFFLLHDALFPKLGIPESLLSASYFAGMAAIVVRFRAELGTGARLGIGLAAALFFVAAAFDRWLNDDAVNLDQLTEDGFKLVGVCVLAAVWAALAHRDLRAATP